MPDPHSFKTFAADISAPHVRQLRYIIKLETERDSLHQHLEELLEAVEEHRAGASSTSTPQKFSRDGQLYATAKRIREATDA